MPEPVAAPSSPHSESAAPPDTAGPAPAKAGRYRVGRNVLIVIACVGVLGLGVGSFSGLSSLKEEPPRAEPEEDVFQVEVYEVEPADVRQIISAFGTARSERVAVISAEVAGRIVEADRLKVGRPVVGDHVDIADDGRSVRVEGDVLVQIDPQVYEQRLARAHGLIAQDDVELRQLEQDHATNRRLLEQERERLATITEEYEEKKNLFGQRAGSATELRRVELDMKQYEQSVLRLETDVELYDEGKERLEQQRAVHDSDLELARIDRERTSVRPPFSGIIAEVMSEEGQYVKVGDPLFQITNNDRLEIPVAVSLADSSEIAADLAGGKQPDVALAVSETAPAQWYGSVVRIAPVADEQTRTVEVYIEVLNDQQTVPLRPGTFVHARIQGPVLRDAVLIPRDAIVDGTVYVVGPPQPGRSDDSTRPAEKRNIIVEQTLQSLALLSEGVRSGDRIVLTNLDVIDDGTLLRAGGGRTLDDELRRQRPAYVDRIGRDDSE